MARPKSENPKRVKFDLRLTEEENRKLEECSQMLKKSKSATVLHAIDELEKELKRR